MEESISNEKSKQPEQLSNNNHNKRNEHKYKKKLNKLKRKIHMFNEIISFCLILVIVFLYLIVVQNQNKYNNQHTILITGKSDITGYAIYDSEGNGYWVDKTSYDIAEENTKVLIYETKSGWKIEKIHYNPLRNIFKRK